VAFKVKKVHLMKICESKWTNDLFRLPALEPIFGEGDPAVIETMKVNARFGTF
jgi:hypothetical protein